MNEMETINGTNFEIKVIKSSKPVLMDVSAEWCGPCKRLEPELEKLANTWKEDVLMVRLDLDASSDVAGRYHVMGVPTLILFKDGKEVARSVGYKPVDGLLKIFSPYI